MSRKKNDLTLLEKYTSVNKKLVKTLIKIVISGLLLYFVFTKIEFSSIINLFNNSNVSYIVLAFFFFIVSQIVSSFRLNYIFHKNDFFLSQRSNLKLYFIGMFYNFFIPGGIGGDAYKVYLLNKRFDWKLKTLTKAVLLDRLIGLIAIGTILSIIIGFIFFSFWKIFIGLLVGILIYFIGKLGLTLLFKKIDHIYLKSFIYSAIIQALQLISIVFIIKSLNQEIVDIVKYLFVFLVSSVLSVISFSGFGAREFVFLKASEFLDTSQSFSTSIGLSFNLITAIVSLLGFIFILFKFKLTVVNTNK